MRYSHSRPALTITTPAGGAILTDPARLTNNRPRAKTQFTWTAGSQTTATTMTIRSTWADLMIPGVGAMLSTSLPAGLPVKVQVLDGASYIDLGAPSSGVIFQRPDGTRLFSVALPDGVDPTTGLQFVLTNNIGGSAVMAADQLFTVGELWPGKSVELDIEPDWSIAWEDSTKTAWSLDQQPWTRVGSARRVLTFTPRNAEQDELFGIDSDPGALDLGELYAALFSGKPIVCIPRHTNQAYSQRLANRNTIFGLASQLPGYKHAAGLLYDQTSIKVSEAAM